MINIQVKNRILTLYKTGAESYKKVSKDEYKQLFYALRPYLVSDNKEWNLAVGEFILHGAFVFDRFVGLRPQYVDEGMFNMFCEFLAALQKLDGNYYNLTFFFHLEKTKWLIFRECSLLPYDDEMKELLDNCETEINKLVFPEGDERVVENLRTMKEEILGLINDIRKDQIRTKIHTTLPFILTKTDATIVLKVNGVNVKATTRNYSRGSTLPGTNIAEGSTMTTSAPSKWATTTCELDIDADCLMDGLETRPNVTLQNKEDERYWNAPYDFTYKIISAIWMHIQQYEDIPSNWPPLPNDIHYIDYSVEGSKKYDSEYSSNPALVYQFTSLKKTPKHYEINNDLPNWSVYAYQFAKVYARSGQLNESIFWLNVSMEALIEEFIQRIAKSKEMLAEIEGEEHKFDTAEEILTQQFPEMKGRVKWPDIVIHTSVFTKLKRAIRMSNKVHLQKDILKKYSQVNAKRNTLFHGGSVNIEVEDIEKAFNAYEWLREHL